MATHAAPRARRGGGFAAVAVLGVATLGIAGYVGMRRLTTPVIAHAPAPPAVRVATAPGPVPAAPAPIAVAEPPAPDPAPEAPPAPPASLGSTTARRPGTPHATPVHRPAHGSHPVHAAARPVVAAVEPDATPPPEPPHPGVTPPTPNPTPPARPLWTTAQVRLAGLRIRGALADDEVKNAVDRVMPALRTCYRTSARAALASPAVTARMSLAIDESRRATNVHAEAAGMPALAACAATAFEQLRVMTSPDTGGVTVTLDLAFVPVSP
jgi:hypothetical protein